MTAAPTARDLSVVMPVWDEGDVLAEVVDGLYAAVPERLLEVVLVMDRRSGEATWAVAQSLAARREGVRLVLQDGPPGLGHAVRRGLADSRGAWILMMDSDGEMDVLTVPRLLSEQERTGADLVVAARWLPGGGARGYDPVKLVCNRVFQLLFRALHRVRLHDLTLGFKLLRGDAARRLPWRGEFHEIAVETTLRPVRAGLCVAEVPTVWTARRAGRSKNTFGRNFRYVSMALSLLREPKAV